MVSQERKQYMAEYRAKNKERISEYFKTWYKSKRHTHWYEEHKRKVREAKKW